MGVQHQYIGDTPPKKPLGEQIETRSRDLKVQDVLREILEESKKQGEILKELKSPKARLVGVCIGKGGLTEAQVRTKGDNVGLLALTEKLHEQFTTVTPLLNETFGADLNQNIAFSGTPQVIHDGGDTITWVGAAVAGTWDFSDTVNPNQGSFCVSLTSANNNDQATFTDSDAAGIDMSNFTAITGQFRLETYDGTLNNINLQFQNNDTDIGNLVTINDFLNTGELNSYQGIVIPKADFGLTTQTVDELDMTATRTGGAKPTFRFDQLQVEASGTPAVFTYQPNIDQEVKLVAIKITMADNVTSISAASGYDKIMSISKLPNGITVTATSQGRIVFSGSFQQLLDFLQVPNSTFDVQSDGTNSWLSINIPFNDHNVILTGLKEDSITFTISDNLSSLLFFRVFVTITEDI